MAAVIPAVKEPALAIIVEATISEGFAEPAALLRAITVAGISCTEAVLIIKNRHMASEGILFIFLDCVFPVPSWL